MTSGSIRPADDCCCCLRVVLTVVSDFMTRLGVLPDMESLDVFKLVLFAPLVDDDTAVALPQLIECLLSKDMRENVLAHFVHLYFLTSEWVCM